MATVTLPLRCRYIYRYRLVRGMQLLGRSKEACGEYMFKGLYRPEYRGGDGGGGFHLLDQACEVHARHVCTACAPRVHCVCALHAHRSRAQCIINVACLLITVWRGRPDHGGEARRDQGWGVGAHQGRAGAGWQRRGRLK